MQDILPLWPLGMSSFLFSSTLRFSTSTPLLSAIRFPAGALVPGSSRRPNHFRLRLCLNTPESAWLPSSHEIRRHLITLSSVGFRDAVALVRRKRGLAAAALQLYPAAPLHMQLLTVLTYAPLAIRHPELKKCLVVHVIEDPASNMPALIDCTTAVKSPSIKSFSSLHTPCPFWQNAS